MSALSNNDKQESRKESQMIANDVVDMAALLVFFVDGNSGCALTERKKKGYSMLPRQLNHRLNRDRKLCFGEVTRIAGECEGKRESPKQKTKKQITIDWHDGLERLLKEFSNGGGTLTDSD